MDGYHRFDTRMLGEKLFEIIFSFITGVINRLKIAVEEEFVDRIVRFLHAVVLSELLIFSFAMLHDWNFHEQEILDAREVLGKSLEVIVLFTVG